MINMKFKLNDFEEGFTKWFLETTMNKMSSGYFDIYHALEEIDQARWRAYECRNKKDTPVKLSIYWGIKKSKTWVAMDNPTLPQPYYLLKYAGADELYRIDFKIESEGVNGTIEIITLDKEDFKKEPPIEYGRWIGSGE